METVEETRQSHISCDLTVDGGPGTENGERSGVRPSFSQSFFTPYVRVSICDIALPELNRCVWHCHTCAEKQEQPAPQSRLARTQPARQRGGARAQPAPQRGGAVKKPNARGEAATGEDILDAKEEAADGRWADVSDDLPSGTVERQGAFAADSGTEDLAWDSSTRLLDGTSSPKANAREEEQGSCCARQVSECSTFMTQYHVGWRRSDEMRRPHNQR